MTVSVRQVMWLAWILFRGLPTAVPQPEFGYLWISTVKAAANSGKPQTLVPSVVVGVVPAHATGDRESFTLSDGSGMALIPLRPGNYCAEAFGTDGSRLRLDNNTNGGQPICFSIKPHKIEEAGITISSDERYKPDIPSKGVE